jgi:hypothetical protein
MPEEPPLIGEIRHLSDQMKVLVDAIDGLALILDHMDRNRDSTRYAVYNLVEKPQQSPESVADTVSCFTCDNNTNTLAEAVQEGWKDFQYEPEGFSSCFLSQCPCCAENERKEEAKVKGQLF